MPRIADKKLADAAASRARIPIWSIAIIFISRVII
jgi:hypothetical protein